ncbi:MAG: helix-turn-helix domain-containing protein [Novosphingobium sp.]|nr:helix-turn-helix domain-containing protein [Novosphingobium sp.]
MDDEVTSSLIVPVPERDRRFPVRIKRPGDRRSLSRSATRALDVLELFGEVRRPLRAVDIARALDMNPSTTNQLLKTMVDSAHLVFEARGKTYLPSPRLAEFSTWVVNTYGSGGRIRELARDVQQRTGQVVTVTTPNDLCMQIVLAFSPQREIAERGLQVPLFGTAIGSAHLSTLDEDDIVRLADRARIAPVELPSILHTAALIRQRGYADGPSSGADVWSLAMPLPTGTLRVPTVLGMAGPAADVRDRLGEMVDAMRAAIALCFGTPGD